MGEMAWRLSKLLACVLLASAMLFGYGAVSELSWRIHILRDGVGVPGTIVGYRRGLFSAQPIINFTTERGDAMQVASLDVTDRWTAAPIGSGVRVRYDARNPNRVLLRVPSGIESLNWLVTPAALSLLLVMTAVLGIRLLIL